MVVLSSSSAVVRSTTTTTTFPNEPVVGNSVDVVVVGRGGGGGGGIGIGRRWRTTTIVNGSVYSRSSCTSTTFVSAHIGSSSSSSSSGGGNSKSNHYYRWNYLNRYHRNNNNNNNNNNNDYYKKYNNNNNNNEAAASASASVGAAAVVNCKNTMNDRSIQQQQRSLSVLLLSSLSCSCSSLSLLLQNLYHDCHSTLINHHHLFRHHHHHHHHHHHYPQRSMKMTIQPPPPPQSISSTLDTSVTTTTIDNDNDDDNADIFYMDDYDDTTTTTSSSSSLSSNHQPRRRRRSRRRRTMTWWNLENIIDDHGTDPHQQQEQQQQSNYHDNDSINNLSHQQQQQDPSLQLLSIDTTVQHVIRIKVQLPKRNRITTTTHRDNDNNNNNTTNQPAYIQSLTQPLMTETVWNQLTGTEWCGTTTTTTTTTTTNHQDLEKQQQQQQLLLDSLVKMGEEVARIDTPTQWIDWQVHSSSSSRTSDNNDSKRSLLDTDGVQVWTGKCIADLGKQQSTKQNDEKEAEKYFGRHLPFIKTRAILPHRVNDVVDLLLDSDQILTYNPWSLGRKDCWIDNTINNIHQGMITKIVQNRVQPPIPGARPVVSTTLLHARPIRSIQHNNNDDDATTTTTTSTENPCSWIIVSRSVGNNHPYDNNNDAGGKQQRTKTSRSDILLGVNLLEPIIVAATSKDDNTKVSEDGTTHHPQHREYCRITTVSHMYSPSVPTAMAERLGVQSSIKFIQDLRNVQMKSGKSIEQPPLIHHQK